MISVVVPVVIFAYEYGPLPGYTGAPGDNKTGCVASGCHSGTPNAGPGKVKILLPSGNSGTYTPGQAMQLQVQVNDSSKAAFGFELTARSGSAGTTQAGDFSTTQSNTQVVCPDGSIKANGKTCPAQFPLEYIEHTAPPGTLTGLTGPGTLTYSFMWTPPATNVGNVTLYVAANAGPSGAPVVSPTNVYLANMVLTPAAAVNPNAPQISANGVVPLFSTATTIQPTSWISIYGTNLATSTALWTGNFPTTLGGASVTINGKPGYLYYASPTQLNLQAPSDTATGSVNVVVTTSNGTSTSTVTLGQYGPSFSSLDGTHVAGIILRSDGSGAYGGGTYDIVGPTGTSLGYKTVAAKAGDSLVLFGVGFGPTNPVVAAGQAYSGAAPTTSPVTLLINNQSVASPVLAFAGLTSAGLYQFNLTVPSGLGTGDVPLQGMVGGVTTPAGAVLSLQ
jgi:uncharacterized protein (TIGR03437 family)